MTVEKPKPKQLLRPITTGAVSATNQSQFLKITCNSPEAREKSRVHGAIGFGFASHWLKNWRDSSQITKREPDLLIMFPLSSPQSPSFFLASLAPLPIPRLRRPCRLTVRLQLCRLINVKYSSLCTNHI